MLRLYEGEVLGKLPVIQHFVFGTLFPCTWTPSGAAAPQEAPAEASEQHALGMENLTAPWASRPPPPPDVATKAPWAK
jgi:serine/threonine-protein phosphatase 2A activator